MRRALLAPALAVALLALAACSVRDGDVTGQPGTAGPTTTAPSAPSTSAPGAPTTTTPPPPPPGTTGTVFGQGDQVIELVKPVPVGEPVLARIEAESASPFEVTARDGAGRQIEVLVDRMGPYQGTVLIDPEEDQTSQLAVQAVGAWRIEILPASSAEAFSSSVDGEGDQVLAYEGPATSARVRNEGSDELEITLYSEGGRSRVRIAGSGNVGTSLSLRPGLVAITADGGWAIDVGG